MPRTVYNADARRSSVEPTILGPQPHSGGAAGDTTQEEGPATRMDTEGEKDKVRSEGKRCLTSGEFHQILEPIWQRVHSLE